jgi:thiamine pyrophosphokinase
VKKKNIIIIGPKDFSKKIFNRLVSPTDIFICADGGYDQLIKMKIKPDVIIGDFDSIKKEPRGIKKLKYPIDKNFSDLELAIKYAVNTYECKNEIILAGIVSESRLDHTFASLFLLMQYKLNFIIISKNSRIYLFNKPGKHTLTSKKGAKISIIEIEKGFIATQELQYNLPVKFKSKTHGLSNMALKDYINLTIKKGKWLVIMFEKYEK